MRLQDRFRMMSNDDFVSACAYWFLQDAMGDEKDDEFAYFITAKYELLHAMWRVIAQASKSKTILRISQEIDDSLNFNIQYIDQNGLPANHLTFRDFVLSELILDIDDNVSVNDSSSHYLSIRSIINWFLLSQLEVAYDNQN